MMIRGLPIGQSLIQNPFLLRGRSCSPPETPIGQPLTGSLAPFGRPEQVRSGQYSCAMPLVVSSSLKGPSAQAGRSLGLWGSVALLVGTLLAAGCTPDKVYSPHNPLPLPDDVIQDMTIPHPKPSPDLPWEEARIFSAPDVQESPKLDIQAPDLQPVPLDDTQLATAKDAAAIDIAPTDVTGVPVDDVSFVADVTEKDAGADSTSDSPDGTPCLPNPCKGVVDKSRPGPKAGEFMCISFVDQTDVSGITGAGEHLGVATIDLSPDLSPGLVVLRKGQPLKIWTNNQAGKFLPGPPVDKPEKAHFATWRNPYLFAGGPESVVLLKYVDGSFQIVDIGYDGSLNPATAAAWVGPHIALGTDGGLLFFQQQAGGTFVEKAIAAGLIDVDPIVALAVADFNKDGLDDPYVVKNVGKNHLFKQTAAGKFTSVEVDLNVAGNNNSTFALWVALNGGDDLPSLLVLNYFDPSRLFVNQGGEKFIEQAAAYGLSTPTQNLFAAAGAFLPNETAPGLFWGRWGFPGLLWVPVYGDQKKVTAYQDQAFGAGLKGTGNAVGAAWLDYNQDGHSDLAVALPETIKLYRNASQFVQTCE